jgi:hypothetical protein
LLNVFAEKLKGGAGETENQVGTFPLSANFATIKLMKSAVFCTKKYVKKPEIAGVFCHVTHYTTTDLGSETVYYRRSFTKRFPVKYTDPTGRSQTVDLGKIGERGTEYGKKIGDGAWIGIGIVAVAILASYFFGYLSDFFRWLKNFLADNCIEISETGVSVDTGDGIKIDMFPRIGITVTPGNNDSKNNYPSDTPGQIPDYPDKGPVLPDREPDLPLLPPKEEALSLPKPQE